MNDFEDYNKREERRGKMKQLKIKNLAPRIPIIQGGMGIGISMSSLAGAVAAEGGIGVISAAQIGFTEPDYDRNPLEANVRMLGKHIKLAKEKSKNGIIGVNIMVAVREYAAYVNAAMENGADLIISGAGLPLELPKLTKGRDIKIVPIISSFKAASILLKMWDKKDNRVPDGVIIEGPKAGGHLGFKKDEVLTLSQADFDQQVKEICNVVKTYEEKYDTNIPVIVAGGVDSREMAEHYFRLGAEGIQVASPFVTTKECDASLAYKQAYLNAKKEDIILVESPVGMPGRAICNSFIKRIRQQKEKMTLCHQCIKGCKPGEIKYCITEALIRAVKGDVENGLIFCGANAYQQDKIVTVKEVLNRYMD